MELFDLRNEAHRRAVKRCTELGEQTFDALFSENRDIPRGLLGLARLACAKVALGISAGRIGQVDMPAEVIDIPKQPSLSYTSPPQLHKKVS
jgi:hypothetical protein